MSNILIFLYKIQFSLWKNPLTFSSLHLAEVSWAHVHWGQIWGTSIKCLLNWVPDEVRDLVPVHHGGVAVEVGGVGVRLAAVAALERLRVPTKVAVDRRQRLEEVSTFNV